MDEFMKTGRIVWLLLLLSPQGVAVGLQDPTMPSAYVAPSPQVAVEGELVNDDPVLQSVIISSRFEVAIIDGVRYRVGELVGNRQLIGIDERGVSLRQTDSTIKRLLLYPAMVEEQQENDERK